jgi:hypothetical protein
VRKTQLLATAASFVAAPALVVAMAAPASAYVAVTATATCGYSQTCAGYAQDVPGAGTGADVAVSCTANTPYTLKANAQQAFSLHPVQATVVDCFIWGNSGDTHYIPGPVLTQGQASTTTYTFDAWYLSSRTYRVCVGAGYFGTDGSYREPANYTCGPAL